jgi:hypothetical protein
LCELNFTTSATIADVKSHVKEQHHCQFVSCFLKLFKKNQKQQQLVLTPVETVNGSPTNVSPMHSASASVDSPSVYSINQTNRHLFAGPTGQQMDLVRSHARTKENQSAAHVNQSAANLKQVDLTSSLAQMLIEEKDL